jgi:hypothetical protein
MKKKLIAMIVRRKLRKMHKGYSGGGICRPHH